MPFTHNNNRRIVYYTPAKINLHLDVGRKRNDGYHDIFSIMQTVDLYDRITITPRKSGISFTCHWQDIPYACPDKDNLAFKAAHALKDRFNITRGASIRITKSIPAGAGLGGGSSDAAAVIKGLTRLWRIRTTRSQLQLITARLGADVSFFLYGGCCAAEGIGELITHLQPRWNRSPLWIILVTPPFSLSTKKIYNACSPDPSGINTDIKHWIKSLCRENIGSILYNRLETAAFRIKPALQRIKKELLVTGPAGALMTGSGSTVYGIYMNAKEARKALKKIKRTYPNSLLVKTTTH